jgi:CRP-like cAMP-binding protein
MPLCEEMDSAALQALVPLFKLQTYAANTRVVSQNDPSDKFYIILQGSAKVVKMYDNGDEENISMLKPGDWFGEVGIVKNQLRNASITCVDHLTVLVTDREGFGALTSSSCESIRRRLMDNVTEIMARSLSKVPMFADMQTYFDIISPRTFYKEIREGTVICRQGESSDAFYVIIHGQAVASFDSIEGLPLRISPDEPLVTVETFEENDYFGMPGASSTSAVMPFTVTTKTRCVMLVIPAANFLEIISLCPPFNSRVKMIENTRRRSYDSHLQLYRAIRRATDRQILDDVKRENEMLIQRVQQLEQELRTVRAQNAAGAAHEVVAGALEHNTGVSRSSTTLSRRRAALKVAGEKHSRDRYALPVCFSKLASVIDGLSSLQHILGSVPLHPLIPPSSPPGVKPTARSECPDYIRCTPPVQYLRCCLAVPYVLSILIEYMLLVESM